MACATASKARTRTNRRNHLKNRAPRAREKRLETSWSSLWIWNLNSPSGLEMASFDQAPPGDPKNGEKIFRTKCAQCHTVEKGAGHKQGNLFLLYLPNAVQFDFSIRDTILYKFGFSPLHMFKILLNFVIDRIYFMLLIWFLCVELR